MITIIVPTGELLQTSAETFEAGDTGYVGEDGQLTKQTNGAPAFVVVAGAEYLIAGEAEPFPALVYRSALGELTTTPNGDAIDVVSTVFPPLPTPKPPTADQVATLNKFFDGEIVALRQLGFEKGDDVGAAIQTNSAIYREIVVDDDYVFSADVVITKDGFTLSGAGSLTAASASGADLEIQGDNSTIDVRVLGNELVTTEILSKSTGPNTIEVSGALQYSVGDQLIVKSDDSFSRALWVGEVSSFSGNFLTVADNPIEGSFANVAAGQTLHINLSSKYHGAVRFSGCDNPKVGPRFTGSERDLEFYNTNYGTHGDLSLSKANLLYQFSFAGSFGNVVNSNSRYYSRTAQASKDCTFGDLKGFNPLFSGQVVKGCHDCTFGDYKITNAPVMTLQVVEYAGVSPSSVNPNCQDDLLCKDLSFGDGSSENGNWIAAIKSVNTVLFGKVSATGAYKSFFGDAGWGEIAFDLLDISNHNEGQGNAANSSAAVYFRGGERVKGGLRVSAVETTSSNGCVFIDSVSDTVNISLEMEGCEQFVQMQNNGRVIINGMKTKNNIDGFQLLRSTNNASLTLTGMEFDESINASLDRLVYVGSGGDVDISSFKGTLSGASVTPTDIIRLATDGENLNVRGGSASAVSGATLTNVVRSNGAGSHVVVDSIKALTGVTNAANVASVTDYLQITNCQGGVVDTTGALTNKNVSGNI